MTVTATATATETVTETANRHPAPGSDVPGAPPALRRPLTADDGVPAPVAPGPAPLAAPPDGSSVRRPVALASAAVTAVAAVVAWRRRRANTAAVRPHASTQETS